MFGGKLNLKKKSNSLLIPFVSFFLFFSLMQIWLAFSNRSINNIYELTNLTLSIFQIISIVLIYKQNKLGFYSFFIIRFIYIFIDFSFSNDIISIFYNILILLCFYIFYANDKKDLQKDN